MRLRYADAADSVAISQALACATACAKDKEVVRNLLPEESVRRITEQTVHSVIIDETYLVVTQVGNPWYSDRKMLIELMVLKISDISTRFQVVPDYLDKLAEQENCDCIIVGGALSSKPRALSRLYRRYGYVDDNSPTLTKRR